MKKKRIIDMTMGSPLRVIILFGLPILVGSILQQLYNMVDSIVVGNYVGANALAAVGATSNVARFLVSGTTGLTTGASIVVAQLVGGKRFESVKPALSTALILSLVLSITISIVGIALSRYLCVITKVPEEILEDAVVYLRIYMVGFVFMMLYNFFAAILRSLGDSTTPLIFLVIASVLNIIGDLWFVIGLKMGVAGVAWATVLAQCLSVIFCVVYVVRKVDFFRFRKGEFVVRAQLLREIFRLGIPSAVQGSVVHFGFILIQGLINSFGPSYMAAYTAASKMEMLSYLPVEGFAMGYSVFVGQNIGAGKVDRTRDGLKKTFLFIGSLCMLMAVILVFVGDTLVGLFVDQSETLVIEYGATFLKIIAPFTILFAGMNVLTATLRGAGDSLFSMVTMITDLSVRVVAAYVLCGFESIGFIGIGIAMPIGWICSTVISLIRYKSGTWMDKAVHSRLGACDVSPNH